MDYNIKETFEVMLEDWGMMQQTTEDEGAQWAERFERHFYDLIDEIKKWYNRLEKRPLTLEELEELKEIQYIQKHLPAPLLLNLETELEDMVDGVEHQRYD